MRLCTIDENYKNNMINLLEQFVSYEFFQVVILVLLFVRLPNDDRHGVHVYGRR